MRSRTPPPPSGRRPDRAVRGARLQAQEGEIFVLSLPSPAGCLPDHLTVAERDVAALMLEGMSNRAIATLRGTSERTIANQVSAVFRKLGVADRVELGRALLRQVTRTTR